MPVDQGVAERGGVQPGDPVHVREHSGRQLPPHGDGDQRVAQLVREPVHPLGDHVLHRLRDRHLAPGAERGRRHRPFAGLLVHREQALSEHGLEQLDE